MKKSTRLFFKSWFLTTIIIICTLVAFFGTTKAYEGIRLIGYGENRRAIEFKEGVLYVFDFEIKK